MPLNGAKGKELCLRIKTNVNSSSFTPCPSIESPTNKAASITRNNKINYNFNLIARLPILFYQNFIN